MPHAPSILLDPREFVRDVFTIRRIGAFRESGLLRPVRSIRAQHAGAASGGGGQTRRRRRRRRGRGARGFAGRRSARRRASRNPNARKATTSACACWSDSARRWSRPTISAATASRNSPSARWRWRGSRPTTNMSGSPIRRCWRASFPISICSIAKVPSIAELERRACEAEAPALAVKGVTKSGGASASAGIGGMVLVTSTGFHGSYLAFEPGHLDDGDRRRRHRHGARL